MAISINDESSEKLVFSPTYGLRKYLSSSAEARRDQAVRIGLEYLNRPISYGPDLEKKLRKKFNTEVLLLDALATKVRHFSNDGYRLKRSTLVVIESYLTKLRRLAF
jgi:hypothetical protein